MILGLLEDAVRGGARRSEACAMLGLDARTVQRWRSQGIGFDRRAGPKTTPANKLSEAERRRILDVVNRPDCRDLCVNQIVPRLADEGTYLASESTMYRVLRAEKQLRHRAASRPRQAHRPRELVATGPNQVWSWDITYLRSPVLGVYFYLYVVVDVWSRKIVAAEVHANESAEHAAKLMRVAAASEVLDDEKLALHSDNGAPMKGSTLLATLQRLGIVPSFSRPGVSDDNPFSEALFRTVKYRPEYPDGPFASLDDARAWVRWFVDWYNHEHRHSAIRFVTPAQRHAGEDVAILAKRNAVYRRARRKRPERWSRTTRDWSRVSLVRLNPDRSRADSDAA